ncbi:hypothetical protein Q5H93_05095 [Hymenobacter sp. ASUV-10]|uniref:Uncharacterized protein n=1 Tax=Hymenobacter aranciens TaxID=3063996 RepID=A0ABT9B7B4_9BACT|nr:hypothetical protein [Hymenobacter sp. ASUV-10]MDO7874100.1 hypothetical protein [Hymenobacter sp. ASUV-10]
MKHSLLLLLLLPLSAVAQYRPMNSPTPTRPLYTPAPNNSYLNNSLQAQRQSQQQAHQQFQKQQAQQMQMAQSYHQMTQQQHQARMQQMQQSQMMWQMAARQQQALQRRRSLQQLAADQNLQRLAEQKATEQVAQLSETQQRKRLEQPAADAQQAAAQQKEDARQLTRLTVKNYQDVFLPGQITSALQAQTLPLKGLEDLHNISQELQSSSWWSQQDGPQLRGKLVAHSNALATLTGELLGYDLAGATPVPAPFAIGRLDEMLANDTFDQATATQLIGAAAQADKLAAGAQLAEAVRAFNALAARAVANPASDQKALRSEVKAAVRSIDKEMQSYNNRVVASTQLYEAYKGTLKLTAAYLAKNETPAK